MAGDVSDVAGHRPAVIYGVKHIPAHLAAGYGPSQNFVRRVTRRERRRKRLLQLLRQFQFRADTNVFDSLCPREDHEHGIAYCRCRTGQHSARYQPPSDILETGPHKHFVRREARLDLCQNDKENKHQNQDQETSFGIPEDGREGEGRDRAEQRSLGDYPPEGPLQAVDQFRRKVDRSEDEEGRQRYPHQRR